jgi:hypothetical protein
MRHRFKTVSAALPHGTGGLWPGADAAMPLILATAPRQPRVTSRVMFKGYNDSVTPAQRALALEQLSRQCWVDAEKGAPALGPVSNSSWTATTPLSFMNMPLMTTIAENSPRHDVDPWRESPLALFQRDRLRGRRAAEGTHGIKGATSICTTVWTKIPFDAIAAFFGESLSRPLWRTSACVPTPGPSRQRSNGERLLWAKADMAAGVCFGHDAELARITVSSTWVSALYGRRNDERLGLSTRNARSGL